MRAFTVAWRAVVSFYNDLFPLIGMSLLWWITGGIFVAAAAAVGLAMFVAGGPWWTAPLIAIPAGPAIMALSAVIREMTRGRSADRGDYLSALRRHWKSAIVLNIIAMVVLALLLLNLVFYAFQTNTLLRTLAILWAYLTLFWLSIQFYVYPLFLALDAPGVVRSLRMAALATFANPLFSVLVLAIAFAFTAISVALAVLVPLAWPALMVLVGAHSLRLLLQRAGVEKEEE